MEKYHESVSNVDDECVLTRRDGLPFIAGKDLEATNLVLVEDGQGCRVGVRTRAHREPVIQARRVQIAPHYRTPIIEEVPVVHAIDPQA